MGEAVKLAPAEPGHHKTRYRSGDSCNHDGFCQEYGSIVSVLTLLKVNMNRIRRLIFNKEPDKVSSQQQIIVVLQSLIPLTNTKSKSPGLKDTNGANDQRVQALWFHGSRKQRGESSRANNARLEQSFNAELQGLKRRWYTWSLDGEVREEMEGGADWRN
ncbi:hypothetical protein ANTPLA_LOCUS7011 [Anthophora plagiata]